MTWQQIQHIMYILDKRRKKSNIIGSLEAARSTQFLRYVQGVCKKEGTRCSTVLGRYYGYPECCIQSFNTGERLSAKSIKFAEQYFVPCKSCAKLIKKKWSADATQQKEKRK